MMLRKLALVAVGLGLTMPAAAWGQQDDRCAASSVGVQPGTVVVNYDPFDAAVTYGDFSLRVETSDCPPNRNLFAQFEPVVMNQAAGGELLLIGADGSTVRAAVVNDRGSDAHGAAQFFNVTSGIKPFALAVPRGQVVVPGDYRVSMNALVSADNGRNTPSTAGVFEFIIRVGAAIGLAPASGTSLDLGELHDGGKALTAATFDAYANVPYRLQVRSDNGFVLKLDAAGPSGPSYRALLDAALLDSGVAQRDFDRPASSVWRRRHSLDAQVETVAGFPAGRYGDYLTVEISARLGS